ncbi:alanine--tRNA ligase [Candidatus Hoaglandella endobia]|uniref:Alanine--tRNA ligase n=1 Tax=Candidatus Hoaglandella endobia TaxID=1778263 RepID=A0A143WTX9_9ENTR|nr:alanine--tRNA ligase [Candidatus Hoaglandella endobia]CUX97056.1 Alanine--tRNA ligase [Candidatus Hoaglandella endobia]
MNTSTAEIRQAFLNFFHSKNHQVVVSSSLVPENDPTLLFTNAGMNQFKDVFLGLDNRSYRRATTSQRCVRAGGKHNDLENVGYTARHHTFFEMLGNFSFGDYFKQEAIQFAWELLTGKQWFNLPKEKLWVTVYATDDEAYNIWANEVGVPTEHIIRIGDNKGSAYASDNFWQMGDTGPCGPCSEIFYDYGDHIWGNPPGNTEKGDRYIEIWNLVFIQFNRQADGTLLPLPKPSVDTGMGLERIASVLQQVNSNYDIDLFKTLIEAAARLTGARDLKSKSLRVIADHIRSCAFLISDGVVLSNEGRGYVLRRIIRRAIRHGHMLGASDKFFYHLVAPLIEIMGSAANQLRLQQKMVEQVLCAEEDQFARTLERGLALLNQELSTLAGNTLNGETAFLLYDTYGFPLDLTADVCRERNLHVDEAGFERSMAEQRKRARQARCFGVDYNSLLRVDKTTRFLGYEELEHQGRVTALFRNGQPVKAICQGEAAVVVLDETSFYGEAGGQVGDQGVLKADSGFFKVIDTKKYGKAFGHIGELIYGEFKHGTQVVANVNKERREHIRLNHTATHLLHTALHQVLGNHIKQKGSLVNDHYLRFDFSHHEKLKPEQIRGVEAIVNQQIRRNFLIKVDMMALQEARNKGAIAQFDEKYEEQVRVVSMGNVSIELCCGTHARCTGDIGLFRIVSESGTAAGIRRIEAITGEKALNSIHQQSELVHQLIQLVKGDNQTIVNKVRALQERARQLEKELQQIKNQQAVQKSAWLSHNVRDIDGVNVLVSQLENVEPKMLPIMVDGLKNQLQSAVIVLATVANGKVSLIVGVTKNLTAFIKAGEIVSYLAQQVDGKGGGRPDLAQGGGSKSSALPNALSSLEKMLAAKLRLV